MRIELFFRWILFLYDLLSYPLALMLLVVGLVSKRIRQQIAERRFFDLRGPTGPFDMLFFCSSAGEYEQALPLIHHFSTNNKRSMIVFFSQSGLDFARARNESTPCVLSPLDGFQRWKSILREQSIRSVVIVRHEIWPGLVFAAKDLGVKLYLINVSKVKHRWLERLMLSQFDHVFAVNPNIASSLGKQISAPTICTGDTKFDRVLERATQIDLKYSVLREIAGGRKIFIIGSAWLEDVRQCFFALESVDRKVFTIVVPHSLSESNLTTIESQIGHFGRHISRWSKIKLLEKPLLDVCIFDQMGSLFELYGYADFALVGGAFHHRVHNTLEPAVFNVPIASGPNIETSQEAMYLQKEGCLRVCADAKAVAEWINDALEERKIKPPQASVIALAGASYMIARTIEGTA